jgi:hypothetical protein
MSKFLNIPERLSKYLKKATMAMADESGALK